MLKKVGGSELWIVNNDKYCGKILSFDKNKCFSIHFHKVKDEVFYVQKGKIKLGWFDISAKEVLTEQEAVDRLCFEYLEVGDAFHVPPYRVHYVYALEDSEVYEFSTHHEESDSYRLKKGD
mgnify:CR=1 FL=1